MIRQLSRLVASRGVIGALRVVREEAQKRLRRWSRQGRVEAARDRAFDDAVGVATHEKVEFAKLDIRDHRDLVAYQPSPAETVLALLDRAAVDHPRFTFVDLGAGKGRACFVAARRPFRRIVGVELSAQLCTVAGANLAALRDPEQRCADITFACHDATTFELPPGPCVIYMYNPFGGEPMKRLVHHLEGSAPRELLVIYYNCACRQLFDQSRAFTLVDSGEPSGDIPDPWAIYRSITST